MTRTVIWGAGQFGRMLCHVLSPEYEILCFADNDVKRQGTTYFRIPVLPPEQALDMEIDVVWIAMVNRAAENMVRTQLAKLHFSGEVRAAREIQAWTDPRCAALRLLSDQLNQRHIPGAAAEFGVYKGEFAKEINHCFPDRELYLFDSFTGFCAEDILAEQKMGFPVATYGDFSDTTPSQVLYKLPYPEKAVMIPGHFPESISAVPGDIRFSFVSIDADLYLPTKHAFAYFYHRLSPGGVLLVHDYNSAQFPGVRRAVDEFCDENVLFPFPVDDFHGSCVIRR